MFHLPPPPVPPRPLIHPFLRRAFDLPRPPLRATPRREIIASRKRRRFTAPLFFLSPAFRRDRTARGGVSLLFSIVARSANSERERVLYHPMRRTVSLPSAIRSSPAPGEKDQSLDAAKLPILSSENLFAVRISRIENAPRGEFKTGGGEFVLRSLGPSE